MIDWDHVANLRAEIGDSDFGEVAEMFLDEAEEVVARLRSGATARSGSLRLEAELHFLKGSALNLGFRELAALCSDGERRAASGKPVDVARVIQGYRAARQAFEQGLESHSSAA